MRSLLWCLHCYQVNTRQSERAMSKSNTRDSYAHRFPNAAKALILFEPWGFPQPIPSPKLFSIVTHAVDFKSNTSIQWK
jgi:hypothetical protein